MDERVLAYAKRCIGFKFKRGYFPGGVNKQNWADILKDCETYVRLSEKEYAPGDWDQKSIDNYKMECIEYRLNKYAAVARNWGRKK